LAEEACDAAVLARGHDPRDYSEYLLNLARALQHAGVRVNVVGLAMPGSCLSQRVRKILLGVRAPRISTARIACTATACAISSVVFAGGRLEGVQQVLPLEVLKLKFELAPPTMTIKPILRMSSPCTMWSLLNNGKPKAAIRDSTASFASRDRIPAKATETETE
jgi:hypothetical protein